jgi:hypothetical protein
LDRLKKIILVFYVLISSCTWAQKTIVSNQENIFATTSESIYIHTNSTSFVTGETLFYKLYCLNPSKFHQSHLSKVAYVELVNSDKKIIFKHKLFLDDTTSQGDYFIMPSIPTGTYKLIAYTKWMLNNSKNKSFETELTIINPFQNESENRISSQNKILSAASSNNNNNTIELNKKTYSNRELVSFKLNNLDKGNYSISVRKVQDLPSIQKLNALEFSKTEASQIINYSDSNVILPELRGEIISGTITSKSNSTVNNISIGLSIPGKIFDFKLVKTNNDGKFIFNLDKAYTEPNIIIQVLNNNKEDFMITLDKPVVLDLSNFTIENDLKLPYNLKPIIEEHSIASQIENTYFEKKADTLSKIKNKSLFYEPIAKEYILDNYTRFPTIKESITEVVKEMHYYKNDDTYTLYLSDYDPNTEIEEPPLVLIDGLLVQNINELLEYEAINIYKISIIPGGYSYGNKLFNGLISFVTKKFEYSTNSSGGYILKTTLSMPLAKKNYFKPDYSNNTNSERIPDYRYQLLWIPEVSTENKISFFTSDKNGTFEIVLEGFTSEGKAVSLKEYFEVK